MFLQIVCIVSHVVPQSSHLICSAMSVGQILKSCGPSAAGAARGAWAAGTAFSSAYVSSSLPASSSTPRVSATIGRLGSDNYWRGSVPRQRVAQLKKAVVHSDKIAELIHLRCGPTVDHERWRSWWRPGRWFVQGLVLLNGAFEKLVRNRVDLFINGFQESRIYFGRLIRRLIRRDPVVTRNL